MQRKINEIDTMDYDVIIVGSGPAGCTIANGLGSKGKKVLILEGGGEDIDIDSQSLYEGEIQGDEYAPLDVCRLRYFGGTSNHWTGMCAPFSSDEYDSELIKYDDVFPYEKKACEILEINPGFNEFELNEQFKQIEFKWSPPVRFKDKYFNDFAISKNIDFVLNCNVLFLGGETGKIDFLTVCNGLSNDRIKLNVRNVVLCCGGIENSRLMLLTNEMNAGLFNLPALGKGWTDHYILELGYLLGMGSSYNNLFDKTLAKEGAVFVAPSKSLSDALDFSGYLTLTPGSGGGTARRLIQDLICFDNDFSNLIDEWSGEGICADKVSICWSSDSDQDQSFIPMSEILLDKFSSDDLNLPKVILNHKIDGFNKAIKFVELFGKFLNSKNAGFLGVDKKLISNSPFDDIKFNYHHCGGTRISNDRTSGVVDKNHLVHGTKNIWIAGSSCF